MSSFKEILLWIWQLPQNLLGLILLLIYGNAKLYNEINGRKFYYTPKMISGISLGNYIIMKDTYWKETMYHEYGHSVDSRRFGPLYLLIIGLPSILGNIFNRIFHKKWSYSKSCRWYYNQPWEKSADRNGGVDREGYIKRLERLGY